MDNCYELRYVLDNGKMVKFSFDISIDYRKYNATILDMYGKHIKKRYVYDKKNDKKMTLKQLDKIKDGFNL